MNRINLRKKNKFVEEFFYKNLFNAFKLQLDLQNFLFPTLSWYFESITKSFGVILWIFKAPPNLLLNLLKIPVGFDENINHPIKVVTSSEYLLS